MQLLLQMLAWFHEIKSFRREQAISFGLVSADFLQIAGWQLVDRRTVQGCLCLDDLRTL